MKQPWPGPRRLQSASPREPLAEILITHEHQVQRQFFRGRRIKLQTSRAGKFDDEFQFFQKFLPAGSLRLADEKINELDAVALTSDQPKHGLVQGNVGTAVLVHGNGVAFAVEFVGYNGHTVALLTLECAQVHTLQTHDIPHARELAHA